MKNIKQLLSQFVANRCDKKYAEQYSIYRKSINTDTFMMNFGDRDVIISTNSDFIGERIIIQGSTYIIGELCHENAVVLRNLYPFSAPQKVLNKKTTFGCGDRLGLATYGHIGAFEDNDIFPIFAQQSMRELKLTNRTFQSVLDDVTFAVFREGFKKGYGADGDHLKTAEDIKYALDCGYTMITLDCSDHINNAAITYTQDEIADKFTDDHQVLYDKYITKQIKIGNTKIPFEPEDVKKTILVYYDMVKFAISIYNIYFNKPDSQADFELSIDEASTHTTLFQHYFIASVLHDTGINPNTVAPKFIGEFQKGIDYIGDTNEFEKELKGHYDIAEHFGYKLSLHSGSDKFRVFPAFGQITKKRFHVKTAGTSWLEAMCIVAIKKPELYREIHKFALSVFDKALEYYHVNANPNNIIDIDDIEDDRLVELFNHDDCRQIIHITYGFILNEKKDDDSYMFRSELFDVWREYADDYAKALDLHIRKHINYLFNLKQE